MEHCMLAEVICVFYHFRRKHVCILLGLWEHGTTILGLDEIGVR